MSTPQEKLFVKTITHRSTDKKLGCNQDDNSRWEQTITEYFELY